MSGGRANEATGRSASGPVICGVEEVGRCRDAAIAADRLARALGRALVLVHVAPPPDELPAGMAREREIVRSRAIEAGRRLLGEVGAELARAQDGRPGLEQANARVDFGDPASRLVEVAEEVNASLIVVGTRGRGPAKAALLGSVAQTVAAAQSRPVLVVPSEADGEVPFPGREEGASRIVCGVDGSEHATTAARAAGSLASDLGSRLVLAHVSEGGTPASGSATYDDLLNADIRPRVRILERAASEAGATGDAGQLEVSMLSGDAATALEELAERESADLIVVGTRGQSALEALALGSVSRTLLRSAERPILVVNEGTR